MNLIYFLQKSVKSLRLWDSISENLNEEMLFSRGKKQTEYNENFPHITFLFPGLMSIIINIQRHQWQTLRLENIFQKWIYKQSENLIKIGPEWIPVECCKYMKIFLD